MANATRRGVARPGVPNFGGQGRVQNMPVVAFSGEGAQSMRVLAQVLDQWSASMYARYDAGVAATAELQGAADGLHGVVKPMDLSTTRGANYTHGAVAAMASTMDVQAMTTLFDLNVKYGNNPGLLAAKINGYGDGAFGELAKINPPAAAAWRERFVTRALPYIAGARDNSLKAQEEYAKQADKDREAAENEAINAYSADLFSDDPTRSAAAMKAIGQIHYERTQTFGSSVGGFNVPAKMDQYRPVLSDASAASGVPAPLLMAMGWRESRGRSTIVSPKNAIGLMQVTIPTGRLMAKKLGLTNLLMMTDAGFAEALTDPKISATLGSAYMGDMMRQFGGDTEAALIAYNAGPDDAQRFLDHNRDYNVIPNETQGYLAEILPNYEAFQGGDAQGIVAQIAPGQGLVTADTFQSKYYSWGASSDPNAPIDLTPPGADGVGTSSLRNDRFPDAQMDKSVLDLLETVTDDFGAGPLSIVSGYRSPDYNAKVSFTGRTGEHTRGQAIDIDTAAYSDEDKTRLVANFVARGARGLGVYPDNTELHVDMRDGEGKGPEGLALWYGKQSYTSGPTWFRKGVEQGLADKKSAPTIPAMAIGGSMQAIQTERDQAFYDHVLTGAFKSWFDKQEDKGAAYLSFTSGEMKLSAYDTEGKVSQVDVRSRLSVKALDALETDLRASITFENTIKDQKEKDDAAALEKTQSEMRYNLAVGIMLGPAPGGKAVTALDINDAVRRGTLKASDGEDLLHKLTDKSAQVSDPAVYDEALKLVHTGHDIRDFVFQNFAHLSGTDASSLLNTNDSRNVTGDSDMTPGQRFALSSLETALRPSALTTSIDLYGAANERLAAARDEFRRRVLAGEDANVVEADVLARGRRDLLSMTQTKIDTLLVPRFSVRNETGRVDVQPSAVALQNAFDEKRISEQEYGEQAKLLMQWSAVQDLNDQQRAKAAAEKGK